MDPPPAAERLAEPPGERQAEAAQETATDGNRSAGAPAGRAAPPAPPTTDMGAAELCVAAGMVEVGVDDDDGDGNNDDDDDDDVQKSKGFVELQPLAAPAEEVVNFERTLVVNGTETVVVDTEDQLPTSSMPQMRYCVLGSGEHRRALMEKRKQTEEALALAERERLQREAEEARLVEEAERLNRQIHALDERHETHETALKDPIQSAEAGQSHATAHHFGVLKHFVNLDYHPEEKLIRKPIVRQFFRSEIMPDGASRDILYREAEHRTATWNELFFDLVMVAVMHSLGSALADDYSAQSLQLFILTFPPIWLIWCDITFFMNAHDNGDLLMKVFVYVEMALVIGMGDSAAHALETTTAQFVGSFLLARAVVVMMAIYHSYRIPDFRIPIMRMPVVAAICSIPYLAMFGLQGEALVQCWWAANVIATTLNYVLGILFMPLARNRIKLRIALNIEHYSERFGLLTIIALGESILSVMFNNPTAQMESTYALAAVGLLATYNLQWIYFDVDASRNFQHALRRNVITGFLFSLTHLPMQMAIVAAGASLGFMISINADYVAAVANVVAGNTGAGVPTPLDVFPLSQRWLFCVAIATALWSMAVLGMLHKSLDQLTVTPLDTFGKKVVNYISGYGFVATRKKAPTQATSTPDKPLSAPDGAAGVGDEHHDAPDETASVVTSESSLGGHSEASSSSTATDGSSRNLLRRKTPMSEFVTKLRSRHATYKANRITVTNLRKTTRINMRIALGLVISLLPLAGENFSPIGLVGTVAFLLTVLVVVELWGGLRVNTISDVSHHNVSSGVAMMLVAAAALAPGAFLSAHGHDHNAEEHRAHIAHHHHHHHPRHQTTGKADSHNDAHGDALAKKSRGTLTDLFASAISWRSVNPSSKADLDLGPAPAAEPAADGDGGVGTSRDPLVPLPDASPQPLPGE